MRRATLSLIPLFAVAFSLSAYAQAERDVKTGGVGKEETLKLSINGSWDMGWIHHSSDMAEVATAGSLDEPISRLGGTFALNITASLQDNVDIKLKLQNQSWNTNDALDGPSVFQFDDYGILDSSGGIDSGHDGRPLIVKELYVTIREVFDPAVQVSFGIKPVVFDVRGSGNPFFFSLGNVESPWTDMDDDGEYDGINKGEGSFAGLHGAYSRDDFSLEFGIAMLTESNGDSPREQERVGYAIATFKAAEGVRVGVIGVYSAAPNDSAAGDGQEDVVLTFGASGVADVATDVVAFAEVYFQTGDVEDGSAGPGTQMDAGGLAWQVGARIDFPGSTPAWAELSYSSISGADSSDTGEEESFLSYEDDDDLLILDSNEWGMDLDKNRTLIKVKGGVTLQNGITLIGKLGLAEAEEDNDTGTPAGSEDAWGTEFDATVEYAFNKNAKVYVTIAMVSGADISDSNGSTEDSGLTFLLGTEAGF